MLSKEHHFKYRLDFRRTSLPPRFESQIQWRPGMEYLPPRRQENRWLQDRGEMKEQWFAGLGNDFGLHDNWATEAMGPLYDRSQEHLGHGDRGLTGMRRALLDAIEAVAEGRAAPFRFSDAEELRQKMTEIVVTGLIAPDKDKYKEVFHEHRLAAQRRMAKSEAELAS